MVSESGNIRQRLKEGDLVTRGGGRRRVVSGLLGLVLLAWPIAQPVPLVASRQALQPADVVSQQALIKRYCVTCHNDAAKTAGLSLEQLGISDVASNAHIWEKVVRKMNSGAMPPAGLPQPSLSERQSLVGTLVNALDRAAASAPNPGRPGAHRLNRAEYANAIRDLLALEVDVRSLLPSDDAVHGFDNIADILFVSPGLLERYLSVARKISRLAVGDSAISSTEETFEVAKDEEQGDLASDALAFGTRGGLAIRHNFPLDAEYAFRVRLKRSQGLFGMVLGVYEDNQIEVTLDGERIELFDIPAYQPNGLAAVIAQNYESAKADDHLQFRVPVKAGQHIVGVALRKTTKALEGVALEDLPPGDTGLMGFQEPMAVRTLSITGPLTAAGAGDTPSRRRIFVCHPSTQTDERNCATKIVGSLARRAYRRPVTSPDVDALLQFYDAARKNGGFERGIQAAIERLLVDPDFLFRVEFDPADVAEGRPYPISDLELASRLSFFLWSSIPDDQLLDVAAHRKLRSSVDVQVRRMLKDPKSTALVENFASQWLWQRNLRTAHQPDSRAFPEFDESLRKAFLEETRLFIETQIREDRGLPELLTANYTFLNERLARHYRIPDIYGSHFRRVQLEDGIRGGLLTQGSVLTVTSYATRTSPVVRGRWILENVLGMPPPPPPPNVPGLDEDRSANSSATMRERMEKHRRNAVCASCHAKMDPLGFSMENFDGVGAWRTTDGNKPIDVSGAMPDGQKYQGVGELRKLLGDRREAFVTTVTEKLLTYAIGRELYASDQPAIRQIIREAATSDYRWSAIVSGIARSLPFQMRVKMSSEPLGSAQARNAPGTVKGQR